MPYVHDGNNNNLEWFEEMSIDQIQSETGALRKDEDLLKKMQL